MSSTLTDENVAGAEIVNAVESPHIKTDSSRRKGSKRSANGDIDDRSQRKRRLNHQESSSTNSSNGGNGVTRTASEEIMDRPNADVDGESGESPVQDDVGVADRLAVNGTLSAGFPNPEQTAPLAEFMVDEDGKPLSKNQQKKRRKQAEWEAKRDDRKIIRKEKLVAKRERKRAARNEAIDGVDGLSAPPTQQRPSQRQRVLLPVTFLIDCDFDDLMMDKERKSLASQVTRSYSDTRKAVFHPHLAVCSFGGELRTRFDTILTHYKGWRGIRFLDEDFVETADQARRWMTDPAQKNKLAGSFSDLAKVDGESTEDLENDGEVVYLTSESPDTLTALKPYSTYIIGGLVDKNREKGICYRRATERGIKTAKLPIGEFMEMSSRKVLATNHVNEIMLKWLECGDWGEAFMKVIPKRKGGKLKGKEGGDGEEHDEDVEDEEDGDDDKADGGIEIETIAESATAGHPE